MQNSTTDGTSSSLLDSHFSESNTSLTISSINKTPGHKEGLVQAFSSNEVDALQIRPPYSNHSKRYHGSKCSNERAALGCSSFAENALLSPIVTSNSSTYDNNTSNNEVLSDIYSTPDTNLFDNSSSFVLDTPTTPISPDVRHAKFNTAVPKYPLNDDKLETFLLNPEIFQLSLDTRLGKGGNAFVYSCKLSTRGCESSSFNVAVKIPSSKNKVKYILQEARFALKLREYQNEWFAKQNRFYPFVDCYGLYYLNRDQFPLFKSKEVFPCLVLKKMSLGLPEYIKEVARTNPAPESVKISPSLWWKLCLTLLDALSILKTLKSVHCDLKTDNIMVLKYNTENSPLDDTLFKIVDFSSSSTIEEMVRCPDMTLQYTAPELLDFGQKSLPTYQTDLFSAGLILLEAAVGSPPYSAAGYDHFYLLSVIKEGKVLDWISPEERSILNCDSNRHIKDILELVLKKRASLDQVIDSVNALRVI